MTKKVRKKKYNSNRILKIKRLEHVQKAIFSLYQQNDLVKFKENSASLLGNPLTKRFTAPNKLHFRNRLKRFETVITSPSIEHSIIMLLEILNNSDVSSYLEIKTRFEKHLMISDYDSALSCLNESLEKHGLSYWYLESYFGISSLKDEKSKPYELYQSIYDSLSEVEDRDIKLLLEKSNKSLSCDRFLLTIKSIVDTIEKDSIDSDLIRFLFDFSPVSKFDISKILNYTLNLNLPDIYNLTSRCLLYLIANGRFDLQGYFKKILVVSGLELYDEFEISECHEKYDNDYFYVISNYLYGNYRETIKLIEEKISQDQTDCKYYDLLVKSHMFNGSSPNEGSILNIFLKSCLENIKGDSDLEIANKIYQQFIFVDAFQYIHLLKPKDYTKNTDDNNKTIYFYLYLSQLMRKNKPDPIDFDSFMGEFKKENIKKVPKFRHNKWVLDEAYRAGHFDFYIDTYNRVESFPKHMRSEVFEKLVLSHVKTGNYEKAINLVSSATVTRELSLSKSVLTIINDIIKKKYDIRNIDTIIYLSTLQENNIIRIKRLALEIDKHIEVNGIEVVENLKCENENYKYIMLNVITTDLIRKQKLKSNSDPLVIRANILRNVKSNTKLPHTNDIELSELIRQYARQKFVREIGMGRLLVQRYNIRTVIISSLSEQFDEIKESISSNKDYLNTLTINSEEIECHELASDFLLKSRDIYTIEDYGIENSLNIHFRHNNIVPELRAPFERSGFICMKSSLCYADNARFEQNFSMSIKRKVYLEYQSKLKKVSSQIDSFINAFKNQQLHVYVNNLKDDERLFKYPVKREDVFNFISMVNAGSELDDMVEWVLDGFDRKTIAALKQGKNFVSTELCGGLVEIVEKFKSDLEDDINLESDHEYLKSLDECIADIYETCSNTSKWFALTEHHCDDAAITVPIDEALEFVKRTNVHQLISINSPKLDETIQIPGNYLVSLLHIFIILFQNAAKSCDNECSIEVSCKSDSGKLIFEISNIYSSTDSKKLNEIKEVIKSKRYSVGARKETGSGLYKICRIINRDIQKGSVIDLKLDSVKKEFRFIFSITI